MYEEVEFTEISQRGYEAYMDGLNPEPPHKEETKEYKQWMKGWHQSYESYDGNIPTAPHAEWKHHGGENYERIDSKTPHNPHSPIVNPHQRGL